MGYYAIARVNYKNGKFYGMRVIDTREAFDPSKTALKFTDWSVSDLLVRSVNNMMQVENLGISNGQLAGKHGKLSRYPVAGSCFNGDSTKDMQDTKDSITILIKTPDKEFVAVNSNGIKAIMTEAEVVAYGNLSNAKIVDGHIVGLYHEIPVAGNGKVTTDKSNSITEKEKFNQLVKDTQNKLRNMVFDAPFTKPEQMVNTWRVICTPLIKTYLDIAKSSGEKVISPMGLKKFMDFQINILKLDKVYPGVNTNNLWVYNTVTNSIEYRGVNSDTEELIGFDPRV